tara:strand:- start:1652 stop:3175 length:1524 start_codon:yes stop_codon:yes gene_type:complete
MLHKHLPILLSGIFLTISPLTSIADEIKLKNGDTISGRITYESSDLVKIEVTITASIKETKLLSRADIAEIVKEAPDNVEFNKLQSLLPTGSLIPASAYETVIKTGPDAFLSSFPNSQHVPAVTEIKKSLEEELDKIERGFIKLEGEWISAKDRLEFKSLIDSRIRMLSMRRSTNAGNYFGLINAMRDYEVLEKNSYGSPAFAQAVELALKVIPSLGGQLQNLSRDVDYRNAEFEKNKAALDEQAMAQIDAARAKEQANHKASIDADKKLGIKWIRVDSQSKPAIESYLKLASAELKRIKLYNLEQLNSQAELLVEADKLIASGELANAKVKISEAASLTGKKISSRSSKSSKGGSYLSSLNLKLNERLAEEAAKEKAKMDAAESLAVSENLKQAEGKMADAENPEKDGEEKPSTDETGKGDSNAPVNAFSALSKTDKKPAMDDQEKSTDDRPSKSSSDDRDDQPLPTIEEEGGFPTGLIIPILTVVLIIVVVLLKVLGVGGKKESE